MQLHIEAGEKRGVATAMRNLAMVHRQLGRWGQAERLLTDALPGHREAADLVGEAPFRNGLAALYCDRGWYDRARGEAMEAFATARQTGDRTVEADSLIRLGTVCLRRHQHHEGLALCRQAAVLATEIGLYPETKAMIGLALCCVGLTRVDEAQGHASRAVELAKDAGFGVLAGQALVAAARVRPSIGAMDRAAELASGASEIQAATGCRLGQVQALAVVGLALRGAGRGDEATRSWEQALAIAVGIGAPEAAELRALLEPGR